MQSVGTCRKRGRGQPGEHFFSPCLLFGGYLILLAVCAYASPGGQGEIMTTRPNARSPPGFGTEPPAGHRSEHPTIRGRAYVERQVRHGGRVPGVHKPHGTSHSGGLSINTFGHRGRRERPHTGSRPTRPPTDSFHTATLGQTTGTRRPRGDYVALGISTRGAALNGDLASDRG